MARTRSAAGAAYRFRAAQVTRSRQRRIPLHSERCGVIFASAYRCGGESSSGRRSLCTLSRICVEGHMRSFHAPSRPAYLVMGGSAMNQDSTDTGARSTPGPARCGSWMAPSRRGLIRASAGLAAGAAAQLLVDNVAAAGGGATLDQLTRVERDPNRRILLR